MTSFHLNRDDTGEFLLACSMESNLQGALLIVVYHVKLAIQATSLFIDIACVRGYRVRSVVHAYSFVDKSFVYGPRVRFSAYRSFMDTAFVLRTHVSFDGIAIVQWHGIRILTPRSLNAT